MAKRKLWELPSLHYEEEQDEHRSVTWLELFFDLFFVVTIAQLTHAFSAHPTWTGLFEFILLFIPVWWVWIGFTYYNERFETQGLENRVFTFALMIPVIGLAVFAHHGLHETFRGFILSYSLARIIITFLWTRAMIHVPEFRPTGYRIVLGFGLSIILSIVAAFAPSPICYILFGIALVLELITPFFTVKQQARLPRISTSKHPERFGLFVIIVLGEMVVGTVSGLAGVEHLSAHLFLDTVIGVAFGLAIWWIYFDFIGRRAPKDGIWSMLWAYFHMPFVMAIAALGAGIANWIEGHHGTMDGPVQELVASAIACVLLSIAVLELCLKQTDDEPTHVLWSPLLKFAGGVMALVVAWLIPMKNSFVLMTVLLIILAVQMVYGLWVWFNQELEEEVVESIEIGE